MQLEITPAIADTLRGIVCTGLYPDENTALGEALHLLQQRDRLRTMLREADESLDRGEGVEAEEAYRRLRAKAAEIVSRQV